MAHFVDKDALTMDSCSQVESVGGIIGFIFHIALDQCTFKFIDILDDSAAMTITQGNIKDGCPFGPEPRLAGFTGLNSIRRQQRGSLSSSATV
jgi:hypothetical protein